MNKIKTWCSFGHRQEFGSITEQLYESLLKIAEQGCEMFYTGAMGDFDSLYSSCFRKLKTKYPQIRFICVMPLTKSINESGDILYTLYDNIIIPTELTDVQYKSVIKKCNRLMVDWADAVFYCVKREYGGTFKESKYS